MKLTTGRRGPMWMLGCCIFTVASLAWAAPPKGGELDPSFVPDAIVGAPISVVALQPDGKVLAAGNISAQAQAALHFTDPVREQVMIARLHTNGVRDRTFALAPVVGSEQPGAFSAVRTIAVQADGRILIAGAMVSVHGVPRAAIARLNPDGTLDPAFDPGSSLLGKSPKVHAVAIRPNGQMLIGGEFSLRGPRPLSMIAQLNPDGSLDTGFDPGQGADGQVQAIALAPDGKALIAGAFHAVGGMARLGIARLNADGSLDVGFDSASLATVMNYEAVRTVAALPDGKVLIGGEFAPFSIAVHCGVLRLNSDGTVDNGFVAAQEVGEYVFRLTVGPDGKVLVRGWYRQGVSTFLDRLYELTPDGALEPSFEAITPVNDMTLSWVVQPDGRVVAGGTFADAGSIPRNGLARLTGSSAPLLVSQPRNQQVKAGESATFEATAIGTEPLGYQWRKNGEPMVPAQTAPTLALTGVTGGDTGEYSVLVSNPFGSVVSAPAKLEVVTEPIVPSIVMQPESLAVIEGGNATFHVAAEGTEPLAYQWQAKGIDLPGATGAELRLIGVETAAEGAYCVSVRNEAGMASSQTVTLTVLRPPRVMALTGPQRCLPGDDVTLEATVEGAAPISLQWFINETPIPGATEAALLLKQARPSDAGVYSVVASNAFGWTISRAMPLVVLRPGVPDPTFNCVIGRRVGSISLQSDGKVLAAGGDVFGLGPFYRPAVRLNPDGSRDLDFVPTANMGWFCETCSWPEHAKAYEWDGWVFIQGNLGFGRFLKSGVIDAVFACVGGGYCPVRQPDGKIILAVGSHFMPPSTVKRVSPIGKTDESYSPAIVDGEVQTITLQPDGKALVGGRFDRVQGVIRHGIARLNADGSLDAEFSPLLSAADSPIVASIVVQPDGKIVIAGDFSRVNNARAHCLARLNPDGSLDQAFLTYPGMDGPVLSIALQENGKLIAGGGFTHACGIGRSGIVRLNADGSLDASFDPGRGFEGSSGGGGGTGPFAIRGWVMSLAIQPDGNILAAGAFSSYDGFPRSGVVRIIGGEGPPMAIAPVIVQQPHSQTKLEGQRAAFEVVAAGTPPFAYQWSRNLTPIPGATAAALVIPAVEWADAASYSVQISSAAGSVVSSNATLAIAPLPSGPGSIDVTFDPTASGERAGIVGADASVDAVAQQADGRLVIAGTFTAVSGRPRNNVARLEADGDLDASFDSSVGANGSVAAVVVQADNRIVIGGSFDAVNGVPRQHLARLEADGMLDFSFQPAVAGSGPSPVSALSVQPDGKLVVGGMFTSIGGAARTNLARLTARGLADTSFNPAISFEAYGKVTAILAQSDGKILVAGTFATPTGPLIRLNPDGSLDPSFAIPSIQWMGSSGDVNAVALDAQRRIVIGGSFIEVNGFPRWNIARLKPDGSLDAEFDPGGGTEDSMVLTVAARPDGRVVAGGWFTRVCGATRRGIAQFYSNGSLDEGFNPGDAVGALGRPSVNTVLLLPSDKVLIGTQKDSRYDATHCLFRLTSAGAKDASFLATIEAGRDRVQAVAIQADGKTIIGGQFLGLEGQARTNLARLKPDGTLDKAFVPELGPNFLVESMLVQPDGKVILGAIGSFTDRAGVMQAGVVRLETNGAVDPAFVFGGTDGSASRIHCVALQLDGRILVGGEFTRLGGDDALSGIARVNSDGSIDPTFRPARISAGDDAGVYAITLQPDGKIMVGGLFPGGNAGDELPQPNLVRLESDGSLDSAFRAPIGMGGAVYALAIQSDGRILVAGDLWLTEGPSKVGLVRLNSDGSLDTEFDAVPAAGMALRRLAVMPDGTILAASPNSGVVRLHLDGQLDRTFSPVVSGVYDLALQADGRVVIGGAFASVGAFPANGVARLEGGTASFHIEIACLEGGSCSKITFVGAHATQVAIESSIDLQSWTVIAVVTADGGVGQFVDSAAGEVQHRFYRARVAP